MASYPIPPWLTQTDPVTSYTHGLQIGSQIGQEQAAQQLHQEANAREEQKVQMQDEIQKAKLHLAADAQARKYAAQVQYQQLVQSGVDPVQALLKVGPQMGITGPALSQLAQHQKPFDLNVVEREGEKYLQTSPNSYSHVPSQKQTQQQTKVHFNTDGTVSVYDDEGGLTTIGTPKVTSKGKAKYVFKNDKGETITGTVDDPAVADLVKKAQDAAKKSEQDAASNTGFHPLDAMRKFLFGAPAPTAQTNASPFKIIGIRRKDQVAVPEPDNTPDIPDSGE